MDRRRLRLLLAVAALGQLALPSTAHAYLDPGTGSFLLQMLIGIVLGGLFAIGVFWKKVVGFVKRAFRRGGSADEAGGHG